jgi:phage-related protein
MEQITFINSRDESIVLGNDWPYIVTKIEGTGAVPIDIQTQKSPFQDGVSYIDNVLEPRPISIELMVVAGNQAEMAERRRKLINIFNPKLGPGKLIYELGNIKKEIDAISELAPVFPHAGDFSDVMQPGLIQLFCPSPFWLDVFETSKEIVTWIGGLKFPLVLPTKFSLAGQRTVNIINDGDIETPVIIEIRGTANNPKIANKTTGEFIKINRTLLAGDVLTITTHFGSKGVEINGTNALHYIDLASTFFNLHPGDNVIEFSSESVNDDAGVKISFKRRYVGV